MPLSETQQALRLISRSSSVLLIVPQKPSADAFASMCSLYLALLQSHEGSVEAISPSHVPSNLQFLPGSSQVTMNPRIEPEVVVDIAGPREEARVRQVKLNGGIRLHIQISGQTDLKRDGIEAHIRELPYDTVVVIGASDLEEIGDIFTSHADFFYNTPLINIDHRASNEQFGTVNVVDITASSIAEIMHELITHMEKVDIEANLATALYAGIVAGTQSFQKPSTKPHAFQLAADLIEKKADKETVIQHLVKTKPLPLLKLSGRIYARLRYDEHGRIFWSIIRTVDFQESGASLEYIADAMHELTNNISGYNVAFLLYQQADNRYTAYLMLGKGLSKRRQDIQTQLEAKKENGAMAVTLEADSLEVAEEKILEKVRQILL